MASQLALTDWRVPDVPGKLGESRGNAEWAEEGKRKSVVEKNTTHFYVATDKLFSLQTIFEEQKIDSARGRKKDYGLQCSSSPADCGDDFLRS